MPSSIRSASPSPSPSPSPNGTMPHLDEKKTSVSHSDQGQTTDLTELGNHGDRNASTLEINHLDEGAELMLEFQDELVNVTEEDYKSVLRKIDWHLMPLMLLLYWVQFSDKTSLGSASILGIRADNDLTQDRFNLCSSLFYLSYLVFEWPCSLLLQRFKTGKVLTGAAASWAVLLLVHIASNNFPTLLTLRMLLGITEGIVTPGFLMITSAYYKTDEQATRVGFWFLMNGFAIIFNAMVSYGCQFIDAAGWKPWKWFFLILGAFGVVVALLYFFLFPDTPAHAWFLTRRERAIALKRVSGNQSGSKSTHFKPEQMKEALKDINVWLFVLYACLSNLPNSLTQQRSIIINELGFDTLQSSLLNIPTGVIEVISIPLATMLVSKFKVKRAVTLTLWTIPSLVGASMCIGLPQHKQIPRLIGVYLAPIQTAGFVISLSWCSAANAGTTKRITANAITLVGYCIGNLVGPYIWRSQYSPMNTLPWGVVLVSYFATIPIAWALHFIMATRNNKRDAMQSVEHHDNKVPVRLHSEHDQEKHAHASSPEQLDTAFMDLTDRQNINFRYPL
ncbi:unnamed protein product [Sympodiomycopsis kandeliae]